MSLYPKAKRTDIRIVLSLQEADMHRSFMTELLVGAAFGLCGSICAYWSIYTTSRSVDADHAQLGSIVVWQLLGLAASVFSWFDTRRGERCAAITGILCHCSVTAAFFILSLRGSPLEWLKTF
jgi:hypothetical protein